MILQNHIFVFFILFCFSKSKVSPSKDVNVTHLISGGTPLDDHNLGRFVVSIQLRTFQDAKFGWYHFCGGSIISPKKILTAAHCLYKHSGKRFLPIELLVVVGSSNRFTRSDTTRVKDVASIKSHKSFRLGNTMYADVGILILKEAIFFNNRRTGIIQPTSARPVFGQLCTVIGWGKLFDKGPTSDRILFVDVEILSRRDCKRIYGSSFTPGMICAGYPMDWQRDSCTGDSGGPLICDNKIVGIVSWGVECGRRYLPGVYTDVYYFKQWISQGLRMQADFVVFVFLATFILI